MRGPTFTILLLAVLWACSPPEQSELYHQAAKTRSIPLALELAESESHFDKGEAYYLLGKFYKQDSGNFYSALEYYTYSLDHYKNHGDQEKISRAYNMIAELFRVYNNYNNAVLFFDSAIATTNRQFLKVKRSIYKAKALREMELLGQAKEILLESEEYFTNVEPNEYFLGETYLMLGNVSMDFGVKHQQESELSLAYEYYIKAIKYYKPNTYEHAIALANMGRLLIEREDYDLAHRYLTLSRTTYFDREEKEDHGYLTSILSRYFYEVQQYDSSIHYAANVIDKRIFNEAFVRAYQHYENSYAGLGDHETRQRVSNEWYAIDLEMIKERERMRVFSDELLYRRIQRDINKENRINWLNRILIFLAFFAVAGGGLWLRNQWRIKNAQDALRS